MGLSDIRNPIGVAAAVIAAGSAAALIGAWIFQYGVGLQPCPLCLEQRMPYYLAVPLAGLIAIGAMRGGVPRRALVGGLIVVMLVLLWGAGLGVYHAGVEWHWWAGPQDCSGPVAPLSGGGNLLQKMQTTQVVRCDEAAWRFLGLSLAGYNVLVALGLAGVGAAALMQEWRRYGSSSVSQ